MSVDYKEHRIFQRLDDPLRFLKWTLDEVGIVIGSIFLGMIFDYIGLAIAVGFLGFWLLRRLKKKCLGGIIKHILYWYLPKRTKRLRNTPDSYKREFL